MILNKEAAVKKWSPLLESRFNLTDKRRLEVLSTYADYVSTNDRRAPLFTSSGLQSGPMSSPYSNFGSSSNNQVKQVSYLTLELDILAKLNIDNKIVIVKGMNDNNVYFTIPHPIEKYSLTMEKILDDIRAIRKDKINSLNSTAEESDVIRRFERIMVNVISSDINEKLVNGNILYIDESIIQFVQIISTALYKPILEFTTRYAVI